MKLAVFFHLWAKGRWQEPTAEFLEALGDFDGPLYVGFVGPVERIVEAQAAIDRPHHPIYALKGWEQVTLDRLRLYAQHQEGAVLYAHTKGAYGTNPIEVPWRRMMLELTVKRYADNLMYLNDHDVVGCHWLTPQEFPEMTDKPFFGGNFWLATTDYIRQLPKCSRRSRGQAEVWIGRGNPTVYDLRPGWPNYRV